MADDAEILNSLNEEVERSYHIARRLLPFLARRNIPVTPKNYRIFYEYLSYDNNSLNKVLSEILEAKIPFDLGMTEKIYSYFYSAEAVEAQTESLNRVTMNMEALSSSMEQSLESALSQAGRYQKVLEKKNEEIGQLPDEMAGFFDDVLEETAKSMQSQNNLTQRIEQSNELIAKLRKELHDQSNLARIDELTQLYNRRHLNTEMPKLLEDAAVNGTPLSLIVFDLDHFKQINDVWGHKLGDKVLALCAQTLKKASRGSDLAVRFGGEEFLLVCPGLKAAEAVNVAERIRQAISETDITVRDEVLPITVSAGVSQYFPEECFEEFFNRADAALYRAKKEGRNRVVLG